MIRIILSFTVMSTLFAGCKRDNDAVDYTRQVYDRLHGKYHAISVTSNEAVDVNMDGVPSINLLAEIPDITQTDQVIIINKDNYLLVQCWPEQYISADAEPAGYDPSLTINYARQLANRAFSLDNDNYTIHLEERTPPPSNVDRFPLPSAVSMEAANIIKIVFSKRLYTSAGWKIVTVTGLYERYTKTT